MDTLDKLTQAINSYGKAMQSGDAALIQFAAGVVSALLDEIKTQLAMEPE
jgi:hypothetical protein